MPGHPTFTILEAPSALGLRGPGVEEAPRALLEAGLARALGAEFAGRVDAPEQEVGRDPGTGVGAAGAIARYALALADALRPLQREGVFPVVLGGDCSILLGSLLALRRRGRYGLLFLDGHTDYYTPETEPEGEAASMELAIATGRGPALLADIENRSPLVRPGDVVALGARDAWSDPDYLEPDIPSELRRIDLSELRRLGLEAVMHQALEHLGRPGIAGFWIHLDVDALDDAIMPAVDYRMAGGLSWAELGRVLRLAWASGRAVGLEVTIYNPRRDPDGQAARCLVACLVGALEGAG